MTCVIYRTTPLTRRTTTAITTGLIRIAVRFATSIHATFAIETIAARTAATGFPVRTGFSGSIIATMLLDATFSDLGSQIHSHYHKMAATPLEHISAVILLIVLGFGIYKKYHI
ncbi:MAG: hypothetical protein WCE45_08800 [Sedimentisphaerales bacterium]